MGELEVKESLNDDISNVCNEYKKNVDIIYENTLKMSTSWNDEANNNYISKINEFKNITEEVRNTILECSKFLENINNDKR